MKKSRHDFNDIVAFADIGDFVEQPVKTYSSGMFVRLAFAVAVHVHPEILVVDEALAVGDAFFQQKCMRFLRVFQEKEGTVLFVSHDTGSVLSLCDHAVLLTPNTYGINLGDAETICKLYLEHLYADPARRREGTVRTSSIVHADSKGAAISVDIGQRQACFLMAS